jgi:hypothetical protein
MERGVVGQTVGYTAVSSTTPRFCFPGLTGRSSCVTAELLYNLAENQQDFQETAHDQFQ